MLAKEALETIRKRLEAARVSHKALETLLKLQPVLEAIEPARAERLDICISLATFEGEPVPPKNQWKQLGSPSRVSQNRAETEEMLTPYKARLTAIATSPVIHYGYLKSLLAELSVAVRGIKPSPDLLISFYTAFVESDVIDGSELSQEDWERLIEAEAEAEIDSLEIVEHI